MKSAIGCIDTDKLLSWMKDAMQDVVFKNLHNSHSPADVWPQMTDSIGRIKSCGDNYGDLECAFCDAVIAPEGTEIRKGHTCWRCSASVLVFAAYGAPDIKPSLDEPV